MRPMRVWTDHLLPRFTDRALGTKRVGRLRERVCAGLHGTVVEVGFGSGTNLGYYPPEVEHLLAVEPSTVARRLSEKRIAGAPPGVSVEFVGLDGAGIVLPDASCDAALSTFTLCTIPDVEGALAELRRVLKPNGRLHFLDHGLSDEPRVEHWQHRLDGLQQRWAGGCHLDRPIRRLVEQAGFTVVDCERPTLAGPKILGALYLGTAEASA